jgi:hypothetical protein
LLYEQTALQALEACVQKMAMRLQVIRKEARFKIEKSFAKMIGCSANHLLTA